jgi:ubiquinone/menaquinone biosynthesis C-methylase UbiE
MTEESLSPAERARENERRRRRYAKEALKYDKEMGLDERLLFGSEHRRWACAQATGGTLEVAIGTGLNLPHYPSDVKLTGLDISSEMLAAARIKATELEISVELEEGDAQDLPFPDATFDTVICTYAMCSVPDEVQTISEMKRVLREGGALDPCRSHPKLREADLLAPALTGTQPETQQGRTDAAPTAPRSGRPIRDPDQ